MDEHKRQKACLAFLGFPYLNVSPAPLPAEEVDFGAAYCFFLERGNKVGGLRLGDLASCP